MIENTRFGSSKKHSSSFMAIVTAKDKIAANSSQALLALTFHCSQKLFRLSN
jgi:hypothetical protein